VTVEGQNFGSTSPKSLSVLIGRVPCLQVSWIDSYHISCLAPAGAGVNVR
jgi:IPT/TIG domain